MLRFDHKQLKRNWKLAKIACCQILHMSTMEQQFPHAISGNLTQKEF